MPLTTTKRSDPGHDAPVLDISLQQNVTAWLEVGQRSLQGGNERQQVWQIVRSRVQHQHGNRQVRGVLLIRKILIDCYEGIEPRGRKRKQFAVLDAGPTFLNNRGDLM